MSGLAQVIGSLLSWLHQFPVNVWPGSWPWTVTLLGALLGAVPVFGALLVALIRKATGNTYDGAMLLVFGFFGGLFGFVLPWLTATFASSVVHTAAISGAAPGMTAADITSLANTAGFFDAFGSQGQYLGDGPTVYEAVIRSNGSTVRLVVYLATLVGMPLLCLLLVMAQQRLALRRGPAWPGRLMWLPFLAFIVATTPLQANLMAHLWFGFLVTSGFGTLLVLVSGKPSWAVIQRQGAAGPPGPPYRPPTEPYRPPHVTPPPSARPPTPTRVAAGPVPPPGPPRSALVPAPPRLAATPGPLPVRNRANQAVLWNSAGGRFRRVRQLGHGGFGTVWLATDTQLDRTVALKFAHAPDAETQQRMMREARALAAVHHPNCVRVYDIIADVDGFGIVMEYIDGQPLSDAVAEVGPVDDLAAARLWATMAGALAAAHGQGVLHRDVKPANILVDSAGIPHLIDFGIARTRGDVTLTAAGMMMGTPDFLAPETAATGVATPASDAWQLAATVSYALTGQPPRGHRANPMSALMAAAQQLPNTHLPERSAHLGLLRPALDVDPARRPTLTTVRRELTGWLAGAGFTEQGPITTAVIPSEVVSRSDR